MMQENRPPSFLRGHGKGLWLLLLTLICMSFFALNSILCRKALLHYSMDAFSYTAVRMTSGALMLLLICTLRGSGKKWHGQASRKSIAALFIYMIFCTWSFVTISAAAGALVTAVAVQTTMVGYGIWTGQKPNLGQSLGLLLAMGGLVMLLLPGLEAPSPLGAALMFISGSAWGAYCICGHGFQHATEATTDNFVCGVPLVLALVLVAWPLGLLHMPLEGFWLAVGGGAVASALGYSLWYALTPCFSLTGSAAAQLSVPLLTAAGAAIFVGEPITMRLLLCSAAIVGGIFIVVLWGKKSRH